MARKIFLSAGIAEFFTVIAASSARYQKITTKKGVILRMLVEIPPFRRSLCKIAP
jgi:hypothetical protein